MICRVVMDDMKSQLTGESEIALLRERVNELEAADRQYHAALETLRKVQTQLRVVIDSAPVVLWSMDSEGVVTMSEGRGLEGLGLKDGDLVGQSIFDFFPEFPEALEGIRRALQGHSFVLETHVSDREWENHYFPYYDDKGRVDGLVGISLDVTKRKHAESEQRRLEQQLQHVQKLESLGVLAGGIAHDFNNLLVTMMGRADFLLRHLPQEQPERVHAQEILKSARRAAELCRQMLAYSGKGHFLVEPIALGDVVEELGELLHLSISKRATLEYDLANDVPAIEADAAQMRQVVMNLITNASDALEDEDGTIRISTRVASFETEEIRQHYLGEDLQGGNYVVLKVSDTGGGMDESTTQRIFDPFFSTRARGRGLGLAAVLGIIRGHRGALCVNSTLGAGTTVELFLPASTRRPMPSERVPAPIDRLQRGGLILLADDEADVRDITKEILEEVGFQVVMAADGRQAVEFFTERPHEFRAVLLDSTMPRLSGKDAMHAMRRIRSDVPVLLASGYSEQDIAVARDKKTGFLQKPFLINSLVHELSKLLTD